MAWWVGVLFGVGYATYTVVEYAERQIWTDQLERWVLVITWLAYLLSWVRVPGSEPCLRCARP